jgi:hypothetical protein
MLAPEIEIFHPYGEMSKKIGWKLASVLHGWNESIAWWLYLRFSPIQVSLATLIDILV